MIKIISICTLIQAIIVVIGRIMLIKYRMGVDVQWVYDGEKSQLCYAVSTTQENYIKKLIALVTINSTLLTIWIFILFLAIMFS